MPRDTDYPYIRVWGKRLGSMAYYIRQQVAEAREDNAPQNAIYKRDDQWATADQIQNADMKREIEEDVQRLQAKP